MRQFATVSACVLLFGLFRPAMGLAAEAAEVVALTGRVEARPPKGKAYDRVSVGDRVPSGSRFRTGAASKATLQFENATKVRVHEKSEVVIRVPDTASGGGGLTVFFGRVWAKVVRKAAGDDAFEVQSANAVAGVRGTEFQVGVADDASTRVVVSEGHVSVQEDAGSARVAVSAGHEVETSGRGVLGKRKPAKDDSAWDGWFSERARVLEKRGLDVARNLKGRLSRRWKKVQELVEQQRSLRTEIEALEQRARRGASVQEELRSKSARLERVTERLEGMQERLQAFFGVFDHWGQMAQEGQLRGADGIGEMVTDSQRIAREFADMFEEGTDLSEEGMEDMMEEMKKGGSLRDR